MAKKTKKPVSKRTKPVVAAKAPKAPRKPYTKAVKPVEAPVVVVTTEPATQTLFPSGDTSPYSASNIIWEYPVEYTKVSKDEPLADRVWDYSTSVISKMKSFFKKSDYITDIRDAAFAHPLIFGVLFCIALFAFSALMYAVIGLY
jgi:hypothetical protein